MKSAALECFFWLVGLAWLVATLQFLAGDGVLALLAGCISAATAYSAFVCAWGEAQERRAELTQGEPWGFRGQWLAPDDSRPNPWIEHFNEPDEMFDAVAHYRTADYRRWNQR